MNREKLRGMIGLCRRAGRLATGSLACEKALESRKAKLLLMDENVSENTRDKFARIAEKAGAELVTLPNGELEEASGKPAMLAAVTDEGFSKQIIKYSQQEI